MSLFCRHHNIRYLMMEDTMLYIVTLSPYTAILVLCRRHVHGHTIAHLDHKMKLFVTN